MDSYAKHNIFVCTSCRHVGEACRPGYELIEKLIAAIEDAGDAISSEFEISGFACMAGCARPCTVAYRATNKASYLFGDIDPNQDIDALVAFSTEYQQREEGRFIPSKRPGKLGNAALSRVPAAVIVTKDDQRRLI
ncbi:hypothetical protein A9Q96_13885 [Rhodobacterales bacterium 52_120_T64]|nr:hypothetical protein A9Q96_13885 [Rhodobacterales bacterium 52_120_T64]